jgi:hypothetical protein
LQGHRFEPSHCLWHQKRKNGNKLLSHKKTSNNDTNYIVIKVSSCFVASDGSAVVEHLSHHSKVIGLSLAAEEEKWQQITFL